MFAVAGAWKMDASVREQQEQVLPRLVEGVKQNPGFVRGFWANDLNDPDQSVTFIVFETLDQAQGFRDAVLANAPAQARTGVHREGLRIVRSVQTPSLPRSPVNQKPKRQTQPFLLPQLCEKALRTDKTLGTCAAA